MIHFAYANDDGDEVEIDLPSKFEVCSRCEGHGTHLNPSIGEHAYTAEEFAESFDDEGREQYFRRGGIYDVTCEECRGQRVVAVVDEEACKASPELAEALSLYERSQAEDAAYERLCAAERRMGC